jgi:hypothetical protein
VAAVVGKLAAVGVVDIAAASALAVDAGVEPGIGVAVVGPVRRRVEGPTR